MLRTIDTVSLPQRNVSRFDICQMNAITGKCRHNARLHTSLGANNTAERQNCSHTVDRLGAGMTALGYWEGNGKWNIGSLAGVSS